MTLTDTATASAADLSGCGLLGNAPRAAYGKRCKQMKAVAEQKGCTAAGAYGCFSFDTFDPLEPIGGLNKG